jgi:hypothetical protein
MDTLNYLIYTHIHDITCFPKAECLDIVFGFFFTSKWIWCFMWHTVLTDQSL